jgi:DNA-binding transcriptional ArsR family regulator
MHPLDALGNRMRRDILAELARAPLPVQAIANRFAVSRPAISRHLRVLLEAGLVETTERGAQHLYAVRLQGFREAREYLESFWDVALARLQDLSARR